MKKINSKIGLYIGLLSLSSLSACVHTSQEMGRPTLGNTKRNYNRNQKKYIIGGACAGLLATAGLTTYLYNTHGSGSPPSNSSNPTTPNGIAITPP
ncbi:hypothetical protein ACRRVA_03415 [Candidatus Cardinium hertigii]|uniref:hypothetical protein n=1 Tax=Candidatus Cardinium hertigii TaxID=247481 RepID=UPI003D7CA6C0